MDELQIEFDLARMKTPADTKRFEIHFRLQFHYTMEKKIIGLGSGEVLLDKFEAERLGNIYPELTQRMNDLALES